MFDAFLLDEQSRVLLEEGRFAELRARDASLFGSLSLLPVQERGHRSGICNRKCHSKIRARYIEWLNDEAANREVSSEKVPSNDRELEAQIFTDCAHTHAGCEPGDQPPKRPTRRIGLSRCS